MSGFSKEWLALREPADAIARDKSLLTRLELNGRKKLKVIDLGTGSASNLRYLAPQLENSQSWTLVDADQALLDGVAVPKIDQSLLIEKHLLDLARDLDALDMTKCDLVTASAFFDLVSEEWIARLAEKCANANIAYGLFVLNFDGRISWSPQDADDEDIRAAFNAHMRGEKGFGPALGGQAAKALEKRFKAAGYRVFSGDSSWKLAAESAELQFQLLQGYLQAASEQEPGKSEMIEAWARRRRTSIAKGESRLAVGHRDVLVCLD
jgi:hypothetical protein